MDDLNQRLERQTRRARRFRTERDDEKAQHRVTRRQLVAAEDRVTQIQKRTISPSTHGKILAERDAIKEKWRAVMKHRDDVSHELSKAQCALTELEQLVKSQGGLQYITQTMAKRKRASRNGRQRRKVKLLKQLSAQSAGPDSSASPVYAEYALAQLSPPGRNPGLPAGSRAPYIPAYAMPLLTVKECRSRPETEEQYVDLDDE